ncbi:MAG TPA: hypothetical protein VIK55_18785 [Paludibacter sp.]
MVCDICSQPGSGTIVPANKMSNAVRKGFNPFYNGCMPQSVVNMASSGFPERWAQSAISGDTSYSDWNICSRCMSKLTPYFGSPSSPPAKTVKDQPRAKSKKWWQFWI